MGQKQKASFLLLQKINHQQAFPLVGKVSRGERRVTDEGRWAFATKPSPWWGRCPEGADEGSRVNGNPKLLIRQRNHLIHRKRSPFPVKGKA